MRLWKRLSVIVAVSSCTVGGALGSEPKGFYEGSGESYPPVAPYPSQEPAPVTSAASEGFYGGAAVGVARLKSRVYKNNTESEVSKVKSGLLVDVFCGYDLRFGRFILGVEASVGAKRAKPKVFTKGSATTDATSGAPVESTSLGCKYGFGLMAHARYNIAGGFDVCAGVGTTLDKCKLKFKRRTRSSATTDEPSVKSVKRSKTKASVVLSAGVRQNISPFFVEVALDKILRRKVAEIEEGDEKLKMSTWVYKLKVGAYF